MLSSSELSAALDADDLSGLDDAAIQKLMTTAVKLYVDRVERAGAVPANGAGRANGHAGHDRLLGFASRGERATIRTWTLAVLGSLRTDKK